MDSTGGLIAPQLLILIGFVVIIIILLATFIGFSLARRRKSKMKLGIPPKSSQVKPNTAVLPEAEAKTATHSKKEATPPAVRVSEQQSSADIAGDLELGIISGTATGTPAAKDEATQPTEAEVKIDLAARLGSDPVAASQPARPAEAIELLRLLRDPQSGQLMVEVGDQRYSRLADIANKKIGEHILKLAAHLLAFTNGVILTEAGMKSMPVPKVGKTPEPLERASAISRPTPSGQGTQPALSPSRPSPVPPTSPEIDRALLTSLRPPTQAEPKPKRGGLFGLGGAPQPAPTLPGINLAQEINDIVQTRLRYSSLAANNKIEITLDLGGGIRIWVNNESFSSPDDIPDQDIRALIKASIKEWEHS